MTTNDHYHAGTITAKRVDTTHPQIPWAWIKAAAHELLSSSLSKEIEPRSALPVKVLPWLYLSDMKSVENDALSLKESGMTHVLSTNVMDDHELHNLKTQLQLVGIEHLAVSGVDQESYDMIGHHWESTCHDFLRKVSQLPNGKVVVHCVAGINRSAVIAGAAMLVLEGMDFLGVLQTLLDARGVILTNTSFQV
jgi:protein-tyrosine phosphatase